MEVFLCICNEGLTAHPHHEAILAITTIYSRRAYMEMVGNRVCSTVIGKRLRGFEGLRDLGAEALLVAL